MDLPATVADPPNHTLYFQGSRRTLLSDGTVLITGVSAPGGIGQVTAELYSPEDGRFSPAGNMVTAHSNHSATRLLDGTVLIAGGLDCAGPVYVCATANAEIYRPTVLSPAPKLFSLTAGGDQAAIWHSDTGQIASLEHPALAVDILSGYIGGLSDGSVVPPQVAIGGRLAEVLCFGKAPGYPALNQINVRVPAGLTAGPAVPVRVNYLGRPSNLVTIGVGQR
jgi:hypothetical protein